MKNAKKISEEQRKIAGITIIALTVSIVILIILAGISTNLILGKNGLIKRAQEAKDKSEEHSKNEEIERQELYNAWAGGTSGGTVVKRAHLSATAKVTSTAASGSKYGLGESIEFELNITNDSSATCGNITIELKRKETNESIWTDMYIEELKPGETQTKSITYIVAGEDFNYGYVTLQAIINGVTTESAKKIDTVTVESDSAITNDEVAISMKAYVTSRGSTITVNGKDAQGYRVGDTAEFRIKLTNDGAVTCENMVINVESKAGCNGSVTIAASTNGEYTVDGSIATIAKLKPGQSVVIECTYLIIAGDGPLATMSFKVHADGVNAVTNKKIDTLHAETENILIEPEPDDRNV